jgi:hypothetical protein
MNFDGTRDGGKTNNEKALSKFCKKEKVQISLSQTTATENYISKKRVHESLWV